MPLKVVTIKNLFSISLFDVTLPLIIPTIKIITSKVGGGKYKI